MSLEKIVQNRVTEARTGLATGELIKDEAFTLYEAVGGLEVGQKLYDKSKTSK